MRIDILSLFPEIIKSSLEYSIIKKALIKDLISINYHNIRDHSNNKQKKVDDYQYGGGSGMVLMIQPIYDCIKKLKEERNYTNIIYLTPDGEKLEQSTSNKFSLSENIILICGHYKGIDQRIREHLVTDEISIGEYVLSGGELAAAVFCDSIIRLIPGVLGDESSALTDSFQDNRLSEPIYTRPENYEGLKVPKILVSGNIKEIERWRDKKSLERTKKYRPGML
ncbi:MAG: tRNA (guanosine(37)-N1)-methyltransferase TrmD [Flavobacteriales bacterium]|nr:MAG: tRNA (guanosine(37)-N1)-methyltransferase TrmD [Flavobacteriales bacterium]|tara:strand:+ start:1398 stop:2069 length:672 start_codon:yes stop_codon:yes gene_type:complete